MFVKGVDPGEARVRIFIGVEECPGGNYLAYRYACPLVIRLTGKHVCLGKPASRIIGILAPVETGICACQGRVLSVRINIRVGVVGVFICIEGSVGCDYLAYLHVGPLVPGLTFDYVCPGEEALSVIGVLAPVEACGSA